MERQEVPAVDLNQPVSNAPILTEKQFIDATATLSELLDYGPVCGFLEEDRSLHDLLAWMRGTNKHISVMSVGFRCFPTIDSIQ